MRPGTVANGRRSVFGALFSSLFDGGAKPTPGGGEALYEDLSDAEAELKQALAWARGPASAGLDDTPQERRARERDRSLLERREALRQRMEEDVVRWHERLGTGLTGQDLHRLRRLMEAHAPCEGAAKSRSVEDRIEDAVLNLLHRFAGAEAWRQLVSFMRGAEVCFPVPSDLAHGRRPEDLELLLRQHVAELEADFAGMPVPRARALLCGDVPVWSHCYPEPGSPLWVETCLRAVAAGLRARIFESAVEAWVAAPPDLAARIREILQPLVRRIRIRLRLGPTSVQGVEELSADIERACEELIPELVWAYVCPRIAGTELAGGASGARPYLDPVCGMRVSAEGDRLEWKGAMYLFCCRTCRRKFESDPAYYVQ